PVASRHATRAKLTEVFIDGSMTNARVPKAPRGKTYRTALGGTERQTVGGARGICGPRTVSVGTTGPRQRGSIEGRAAPGTNAVIAGASESALQAVMQAGPHRHSPGSLAG